MCSMVIWTRGNLAAGLMTMVEAIPDLVDRRVLRQTDDILLGFPVVCFFGRLIW